MDPVAEFQEALAAAKAGRYEEAKTIALDVAGRTRDMATLQAHCGLLLHSLQAIEEAAICLGRAHELVPSDHRIQFELLRILMKLERVEESIRLTSELVNIDPNNVELLDYHVICLAKQALYSDAISFSNRRLKKRRDESAVMRHYGLLRRNDLCAAYDFLLQYSAEFPTLNVKRNLAESALYCDHLAESEIARRHSEAAQAFLAEFPRVKLITNKSTKKRIGFISGDFREHAVNFFCQHLIENLRSMGFQVFVYSTTDRPDSVTKQYSNRPNFRDFSSNTDYAKNLEIICKDELDLLIDLGGLSNSSRPDYVACHPAKVVLGAIGYPMASPLALQLGDTFADVNSSEVVYMDRPFLCYDYGADLPALPKDSRTEIVTFGSFNANEKLTNSTLKLWADALRDLGECRLLIKLNYSPGERLLHEIEQHFSSNVMVEFLSSVASHSEHLQRISQVDIALDSFPYNGTTTTIECLLMGTPVVTLAGESHRSRVSGSILTATGNNEWIASSPEEFKSIVHKLKATIPTRQQVRESLTNSSLMDTKDYATKFGKLINHVLND